MAQPAADRLGQVEATSADGATALEGDPDTRLPPVGSAASVEREAGAGAEDLIRHLAERKKSKRVIPRIPRGARIQAAGALCELVDKVVLNGSETAWSRLLKFALHALSRPARGKMDQHEASLTSKIKQQIARYMGDEDSQNNSDVPAAERQSSYGANRRRRSGDQTEALKRRVAGKLVDGDVRGAIRLLSSGDQIADDTEEVIRNLQAKHPPAPADLCLPPEPDDTTAACCVVCPDRR